MRDEGGGNSVGGSTAHAMLPFFLWFRVCDGNVMLLRDTGTGNATERKGQHETPMSCVGVGGGGGVEGGDRESAESTPWGKIVVVPPQIIMFILA